MFALPSFPRRFPVALAAALLPATLFAAHPIDDNSAPVTALPGIIVTDTGESPAAPPNTSVTTLQITTPQTTATPELQNLSGYAPNFYISDASQHSLGAIYAVRGVANTVFFSDPAVGLYVDDVPYGSAFSFVSPLYDVDHIDIFRGPQPDRFGLNTEGGLISIHTRQADPETWHGEASYSFASYDTQEYRLSLSGPLIKDKLTIDLGGYWGIGTGFIDNTYLKNRRDDRDTLAGRVVLTWTPTPDWRIVAGAEGTRINDGEQRLVPLNGDPYQVRSNIEGIADIHQQREWLDITKKFETWEVRSITSHAGYEANPTVLDLDFSPAKASLAGIFPGIEPFAPGADSTIRRTQDEWSTELRFESLPPEPPLPNTGKDKDGKDTKKIVLAPEDRFHWQAGFFYQRNDTNGDDLREFSAPFVTAIPFGPFLQPITVYTPLKQTTDFTIVSEEWAGYANAGYKWDKFELDAGVRLDYDRKVMHRSHTDGLGGVIRINGEDDDVTVAGSLGGTYHATPNVDVFVRTSYGFKPGGFSAFTDNPKLAEYSRETDWSTELGVKAQAFDGKLKSQLVGYYDAIDNYQVERTFDFTDYMIVNANRAESLGVEFELSYEILPGLTLNGNIGYNQTQLLGYHDPITGEDLSGNEAPYVPEFTALAALDYAHESGFRAHVEYVAYGETQYTDTNLARYRQAPYGLLNARIGYEKGHYGVYLFGRNLGDTRYFTQKSSDIDAGIIGEPRILGVMAMLKF